MLQIQEDRTYCQRLQIKREDKELKYLGGHKHRKLITKSRVLETVLSRHGTKDQYN